MNALFDVYVATFMCQKSPNTTRAVQYHSILVDIFVVPVCLVPGFSAALRVTTMAILESMLSTLLAIVL